jgi:hypothetical protein
MTTQTRLTNAQAEGRGQVSTLGWLKIGLLAAAVSIAAVLIVQALILSIWPEAGAFKPLDSYARSAVFTLVPAVVATALFAWLARTRRRPDQAFIKIAAVVLLLSFIPDYLLPDANKTFLASTLAAFLHLVAALGITGALVYGYRRAAARS